MSFPPTPLSVRRSWHDFLVGLPDFQARLFMTAAGAGLAVALIGAGLNALNDQGTVQVFLPLLMAAVAGTMMWFARITGRYAIAGPVTVAIVFVGAFSWMFLTGGGTDGGMPALLVFAVAFTGIILHGRTLWTLVGIELAVYTGLGLFALANPGAVPPIPTAPARVTDVIICVTIAGPALAGTLHLLLRVHARNASLLAGKNAELEQIDKERSEFLAMVAHELNTPLAVMRVHLDDAALNSVGAPNGMHHTLRVMTAENERLSRLVGQLRDISRISSGPMAVELQAEDLSAIIAGVLRTYQPLVARNGNALVLARGGAHPLVLVDAERVAQVLVNLLSNATRHTTDGTISVAVSERGKVAEVTVTDTGTGIAPEVLAHLFQRIGRRHPTGIHSSRDAGLGLGLIISQHIMTAHGGAIEIESGPGGTTARLTFLLAGR
ncbi:MAG TPA: HAMP domain-containing sensor histidine kinase [Propionicimonas sp.]|jgi:signal transduction histidine kinase